MGFNLGESIQEFRKRWEYSYLVYKGKCNYHDLRFKQGWIPPSCVPYSPTLGRFNPETNLSQRIVKLLEGRSEFIFKEHGYFTIDKLEKPLKEVMFHIPYDLDFLIADYSATPLMLDRKAFLMDSNSQNKTCIQWYLSR